MESSGTCSNVSRIYDAEVGGNDQSLPGFINEELIPMSEETEGRNNVASLCYPDREAFLAGSENSNYETFGNRRLYIGNISNEVTEETLREFFQENGLTSDAIGKVILRHGYAFVECRSCDNASQAIERCNMKPFMNTVLRVEAAAKPGYKSRASGPTSIKYRSSTQLLVANCSLSLNDIQTKFSLFGPVTAYPGHHAGTFVIHTMGAKHSESLITEFHGKNIGSTRLAVHSVGEESTRFDGSGDAGPMSVVQNRNMHWKNNSGPTAPPPEMDFSRGASVSVPSYATYHLAMQAAAEPPLKILVPNEFVGAVIGRGGSTIRTISKTTGARLDIFRNCSRYEVPEKPVTIYGPPEKASKACRKILEIIAQEMDHQDHKGELALRMFAQDSYIGRVIGKGGSIIKKLMDETQTKIHISTQSDFGKENVGPTRNYVSPTAERLITIRGSIDGMCKAEGIISEKMRDAYQNEIHIYENGYGGNNLMGSRPYLNATSTSSDDGYVRSAATGGMPRRKFNSRTPFTFSANPNNGNVSQYIPGGTYSTYPSGSSAYTNSSLWNADNQINLSRPETVNMYIPDDVVGALIGRRGTNVRQIIQQTGASVKIMDEKLQIDDSDNFVRRVVINGGIDSLFKAQYLIYDKVVEEGKGPVNHQIDDIRLTLEMSVPSEMVGRLIGKSGQNIRDIQKNFLCRVKFMTDEDATLPPGNPGETFVRITGNYNAFLGAQKQIREMLVKAMTRSFHGQISGGKRKEERGAIANDSTSIDAISTDVQMES